MTMITDDTLLLENEPAQVTIQDLQMLADQEEAEYINSTKPRRETRPAVIMSEAQKAQEELNKVRTQLFRVKAQALEGLSNFDLEVLSMAFNGYLPSEIALQLDRPLKMIRATLNSPTARAYIADMTNEVADTFKTMMAKGVTVLRDGLDDPDPRIRMQAFRELAKINGLYSEEERKPVTAEDVVGEIIKAVRASAKRHDELPARPHGFSRLIEGTVDGDVSS